MATTFDILDTAVKIGLGAFITGMITYINNKANQKHEFSKVVREEKVKLVREYALHIEVMETHINDCIAGSGESKYSEAKSSLVKSCNEAYSARSISNLLGSAELFRITDDMCQIIESIYPLLENDRSKIFEKSEQISNLKKESYPQVQDVYKSLD